MRSIHEYDLEARNGAPRSKKAEGDASLISVVEQEEESIDAVGTKSKEKPQENNNNEKNNEEGEEPKDNIGLENTAYADENGQSTKENKDDQEEKPNEEGTGQDSDEKKTS